MPGTQELMLVEDVLYAVGAFVFFSVSYVSYKGYRAMGSPTLLRLAVAFTLLGVGYTLNSLGAMGQLGLIPALTISVSILLVVSALLETAGYFFLAFSHVLNTLASNRLSLSLLLIPASLAGGFGAIATAQSLSLLFLLYGVIQTIMAYPRVKRPTTLLIALGLGLIAVGELVGWVGYFPNSEVFILASQIFRIAGFGTMFVPVAQYAMRQDAKVVGDVQNPS